MKKYIITIAILLLSFAGAAYASNAIILPTGKAMIGSSLPVVSNGLVGQWAMDDDFPTATSTTATISNWSGSVTATSPHNGSYHYLNNTLNYSIWGYNLAGDGTKVYSATGQSLANIVDNTGNNFAGNLANWTTISGATGYVLQVGVTSTTTIADESCGGLCNATVDYGGSNYQACDTLNYTIWPYAYAPDTTQVFSSYGGINFANVTDVTEPCSNSFQVDLNWAPVSGASGYLVQVYDNGQGMYSFQDLGNITSYVDNGLYGGDYQFTPGAVSPYVGTSYFWQDVGNVSSYLDSAGLANSGTFTNPKASPYVYYSTFPTLDISGNGNHGVVIGGGHWIQGLIGTAMNFVANNSQYVQITNTAFLPINNAPRTMSGWIKTNGTQLGRMNYFGYGGASTNMAFELASGINGDGKIYFIGYANDITGTTLVADGKWHFIAVTYAGGSGTVQMYVDGKKDNSAVKTLGTSNVSTYPFVIGRQSYGDYGGTVFDYVNGIEDDVRLYNRALSASEIKNLYYAGWYGWVI